MARYAALEEAHTAQQLRGVVMGTSRDDLMDAVQGLGQSIPTAISIATDACKRCVAFTEGCAFPGLIKALKVYFSSYLDLYSGVLRQLEANRAEHETWNVFQMCLTLLQTTGELLIELKRLDQDLIQNILECSRKESFNAFITILLVPLAQQELRQLISAIQDGVTSSCLESVTLSVEKFCREVHYTTYKVIFSPVSLLLDTASHSWSAPPSKAASYAHNMPDYSFAPQEYITEIGEYLMTLPQHLEPFLMRDNPALTGALHVGGGEGAAAQAGGGGGFADLLLGMVARGTCQTYLDHILAVSQLTPAASKQLAIDIKYLGNVLEDLGFGLLDSLQHVSVLLKVPAEEYQSQTTGAPPKLVAAVRQMRNIPST
ncbi:hypothetical protein LSTR_LSTR010114 [Laodelphax striatellus]|uniref:Conserved oligomeric Golgi complex subunit 7 n=1 Tax=Laodelphax striatellus TaxID=195883 RepID=A0A482X3B9_LAOST|nr:hypothetical protein LSTR_LSTR010114 [Laodelphax striatellus]